MLSHEIELAIDAHHSLKPVSIELHVLQDWLLQAKNVDDKIEKLNDDLLDAEDEVGEESSRADRLENELVELEENIDEVMKTMADEFGYEVPKKKDAVKEAFGKLEEK